MADPGASQEMKVVQSNLSVISTSQAWIIDTITGDECESICTLLIVQHGAYLGSAGPIPASSVTYVDLDYTEAMDSVGRCKICFQMLTCPPAAGISQTWPC